MAAVALRVSELAIPAPAMPAASCVPPDSREEQPAEAKRASNGSVRRARLGTVMQC